MTENNPAKKGKTSFQLRVSTAVAIVAVILGCIIAGNFYIALLFIAIALLGGIELSDMLSIESKSQNRAVHMLFSILPLLLLKYVPFQERYSFMVGLSVAIMLGLTFNLWLGKIKYHKFSYLFTFFYWGLPLCLGSYYLNDAPSGENLKILGVILLLWTSDTMAYFTGKQFGKNKLFPSVSPGKTIEGSLGAGFFSILVGLLLAYVLKQEYSTWIVISVVVWIAGTLGDLIESKLKRTQKVKDSGTLLPGHGGFLDRFDSLVMIIPILLAIQLFFG